MTKEELLDLIVTGEGYKIEFKENIDKTFVEEVTAFANASGGKILIGVTDTGTVKGIDTSDVMRSRIQDTISQVKPNIAVDMEVIDNVIVINVPEGKDKPYACSKGFYLRMGSNSQKLDRDQIIEFFQVEGKVLFDEVLNRDLDVETILENDLLSGYLQKANISDVLPKIETLLNLDCAVEEGKKVYFTNAGILFFAKRPADYLKHCYVVCVLFKGLDKEIILDRKEFKGDIVSNIEDTILFLKKHLNLRYEIQSVRRKEILDIPEVALREAVINAHCHRDYFEKGAQIMVEVYEDRVVITNPGGIPKGLDSKKFGQISITRNPIIASMLQRANYIEKMGTGITRITNAMKSAGLPPPDFETEGFFVTTLYRESYITSKNGTVNGTVNNTVNGTVNQKILQIIKEHENITIARISELTDISRRTIQRKIIELKEQGIIERIGSDKKGSWRVK